MFKARLDNTGTSQLFFPFLTQEALKKKKTERLIHMGPQLLCSSENGQHPLINNFMAWRSVQARDWNWH